jgi:fido (protein-threonine AMPylation protein)
MVTQYDLFVYLGDRQCAIKTPEIMRQFKKRPEEYPNIYRLLMELLDNQLITKSEQGFQVKYSTRSQLLYRLITYCIANGINYNYLLDRNIAEFIAQALLHTEFSFHDFDLAPQTFKKYTAVLKQYGLLLPLSKKPYRASVPYNLLIANLLQYFGIPVLVKKEPSNSLLPTIEKDLKRFNTLAAKNEPVYHRLVGEYNLRFIHASLSLEGNPVTLPDTVKILQKQIIPKELRDADVKEIQHYQNAVHVMMEDSVSHKRLTGQRILDYHFLAMQHRPDIAGRFRVVPVHIKGNPQFNIAPLEEIETLLAELLHQYTEFVSEKQLLQNIISFAAYFHNQFQYIHPFEDGNSRTARLLMLYILQYHSIPVLDIPLGLLDQYQRNTKGYKQRKDKALESTLQYIILYNLKTINGQLVP